MTAFNVGLKPSWGKAESVEWNNEGFHVQGWLLYPADYDPAKRYPMIVVVHGGPSSAVIPRWPGVGYGAVPFSRAGLLRVHAQPARQLRPGREVRAGESQGFRLRRPA
ncbi:hypothetical protein [Rhodanobacter lindaniclasticus]